MNSRLLIVALLAALLIVALPAPAQPPPDAGAPVYTPLPTDVAWLTIHVLKHDGAPTPDWLPFVCLYCDGGRQSVTSDTAQIQDGSITFGGLTPGECSVRFTVGDYDDTVLDETRQITIELGANSMEWRFPELASLTIKATTADGRDMAPPPHIEVEQPSPYCHFDPQRVTVLGNMLTYTDIFPGHFRLEFYRDRDVILDSRNLNLKAGSNTLDWQCPPLASVTFHLTNADGAVADIAGLAVTLRTIGNTNIGYGTSKPAQDGTVTFTDTPAGDYHPYAKGKYGTLALKQVSLLPGDNAITWTLPSLSTLSVTLDDALGPPPTTLYGKPATQPWALLLGYLGPSPGVSVSATNWFAIGDVIVFKDLVPGTYHLTFYKGSGALEDDIIGEQRDVIVAPGENSLTWTPPQLATLVIHSLNEDGKPEAISYPGVKLTRVSDGFSPKGEIGKQPEEYRYPDLPVGVYQVTLTFAAYSFSDTRVLTVTPGEQIIEWRVPAIPTVTGDLTAAGHPVSPTRGLAAYIFGYYPPEDDTKAVAFTEGRYILTNVPTRMQFFLLLTDAGWAMANVMTYTRGDTLEVPLALQPGGGLEVQGVPAITYNNRPNIPGRLILTHLTDTNVDYHFLVLADDNGTVSIPSLPPGHWQYKIGNTRLNKPSGDVMITAGQTTTLTIPPPTPPAGGNP